MMGAENGIRPTVPAAYQKTAEQGSAGNESGMADLRLKVQQHSLREQLERNHFLLVRLNAASGRLIQTLDHGDVFEGIAEVMANLVGSEQIAIFDFHPQEQTFSLAWSLGVEEEALKPFLRGAGMFGRAVQQGVSQFRERQPESMLLPYEKTLTACILLKSSREIVGMVAIFGLLPQKTELEWADFEILKFVETYGAVAMQFQRLRRNRVEK